MPDKNSPSYFTVFHKSQSTLNLWIHLMLRTTQKNKQSITNLMSQVRKNTLWKLKLTSHIASMWQNWYSQPNVLTSSSLVFSIYSWRGTRWESKWKQTGLSSFLSHSCFERKMDIGFFTTTTIVISITLISYMPDRHYAQVLNKYYLIWCSQQLKIHYLFFSFYMCENWSSEM